MELKIFNNYEKLSAAAADMIVNLVKKKPDAVLCLATGNTPKLTYQLLAAKANAGEVDLAKCFFIGLDEWVGISPDNSGSCHWFLQHYLFKPMQISDNQIYLFDALAENLENECEKMNEIVIKKDGIDLMLVGVGMNGHIGFNEPGTTTGSLAHVTMLDATTLSVGKKYFNGSMNTNKGITLGLKHFANAHHVIMMANGKEKSAIIKKTLESKKSADIPSTLIQEHQHAIVLIDRDAAVNLKIKNINSNLVQ